MSFCSDDNNGIGNFEANIQMPEQIKFRHLPIQCDITTSIPLQEICNEEAAQLKSFQSKITGQKSLNESLNSEISNGKVIFLFIHLH